MFKSRLIRLTKGSQQGHNTMMQKKVDIAVANNGTDNVNILLQTC